MRVRTTFQGTGAGGIPHFRLHIQPGSPSKPRNNYTQSTSRAGEGKGLQVFPGSVTEVTAPDVSFFGVHLPGHTG
jgi:hypothetical protein